MRCHNCHRESMSSMLREIVASSLAASCRCQHRFQQCVILAIITSSGSCVFLRKLVRSLSEDSAKILIPAFINIRLDYCNSLYFGIADDLMSRLQSVQNRKVPHISSPESGGASTSRQAYVSCTGCQSADKWILRYPPSSIVHWHQRSHRPPREYPTRQRDTTLTTSAWKKHTSTWTCPTVFTLLASTLSITPRQTWSSDICPQQYLRRRTCVIVLTLGCHPCWRIPHRQHLQAAIGALEPHSLVTNPSTPSNLGRRFQ